MIEHIVLLKFSEQSTDEQKNEAVKRCREMKGNVPGLVNIEAGINFSERSQGFSIGMTILFENEEALKEFAIDQYHEEVKTYLKEIGHKDTLVVDFAI
ncbi:Dabb family protein [Oceanobacillus saliphilus]|uniref:Dabb family protein n=1 Tax=Oceanobacillus saliphilus TaxID=2925834 RepID=UPI00201DF8C8|nr:Dabb family protein [Oceanobacillus saliphilus]